MRFGMSIRHSILVGSLCSLPATVLAVAASPIEKKLASGGADGVLRIWTAAEDEERVDGVSISAHRTMGR